MPRVTVAAAEAILGDPIPCLDKGHVMLVDYMGGDESVTQAARTSYAKDLLPWDPVGDPRLINYLMKHRHTTPFEMVQIKVRMKLPMFVARQWVRHRTASLNEVSGRYSALPGEFYLPELGDIQGQSADNKQGRSDGAFSADDQKLFRGDFAEEQQSAYLDYDQRIKAGMAKELARINLPLSTYTEWYWDQNLWNMLHLLGLRMDPHAQLEIRAYANALYEVVRAVAPVSLAAWEEHMYLGARFSRTELAFLRDLAAIHKFQLGNQAPAEPGSAQTVDPLDPERLKRYLGERGSKEFLAKIAPEA